MSAVGMTAENVTVPEADPVFSEVQLLAATLKSFKRGYRISNELVRHSVLAIASVMGQAVVERTALEIDAAFLTGTGTSNTITGFTSMAGTSGATLGASVVPTIDNLLDAQGSLLAANASLDDERRRRHRRGNPHRPGHQLPAAGRPGAGLHPGPRGPGRRQVHPGRHEPGRRRPRHRPVAGRVHRDFADSDQLDLRVVARYDIKPLNAAGIYIITTV
jgi:Phage capsid family